MVCSIIDECRCYAYDDVWDPKKRQFCGVRRGPHVVPCPENECCAGGCPGEDGLDPREPFRIIKRPLRIEGKQFQYRGLCTHFTDHVFSRISLVSYLKITSLI